MKKIKLGIIGAGNIVKSRHLPALMTEKDLYDVVGILDTSGEKSKLLAEIHNIPNHSKYDKYEDLEKIKWLKKVDAVIVAIPPREHYKMVKQCLLMGKHVLVEKPFVVNLKDGDELITLANKKRLILALNHNFQFSRALMRLKDINNSGEFGSVRSIYGVQFSNDTRRLPKWSEETPLGLFYDESPHFMYLFKLFAGDNIEITNAWLNKSTIKETTPKTLSVEAMGESIPISMYLNFESPICEWNFVVVGDKNIGIVDLFRDILIVLPNDGQHLGKEVMLTSILSTWQHWKSVVVNGYLYLRGRMFYGFTEVHGNFYKAVTTKNKKHLLGMSAEDGLYVNRLQHSIINKTSRKD